MSRSPRLLAASLLVCALLVVASGCGSSKPGYCADRTKLQNSVKSLTSLSPSAGLSGLQAELKQLQSEVNALVASAKSDFPSETSAIRTSFEQLATDVRALPSNPSTQQIAALASDASAAVSAVSGFVNATKSKCD
ncbi:MAG: hypothetical protein JSS99_11170 [Actinobacteria bacterium]|nr:hypothetical protein [Actinomycetota bacterium]